MNNELPKNRILRYIASKRNRIFFSPVPFILFFVFAIAFPEAITFKIKSPNPALSFVLIGLLTVVVTYVALTTIHYFSASWHKKTVRLWFFTSICWMACVFFYVVLFQPYGYMSGSDKNHMVLVMLIPPAFIGGAVAVYFRFIK